MQKVVLVDNNLTSESEKEMDVAIHAIFGSFNKYSMRILEKMGSFLVDILVDLGSTHNFLDPSVASTIKLKISK